MRIIVLGCFLCAAACSSSTTGGLDAGSAATDLAAGGSGGNGAADLGGKSSATIAVVVPGDFHGTPRQLLVAAFDQIPVTGPPAAILYQGTPAVTPGATLHLTADAGSLAKSEQLLAVLYVQGGGQFSPQPGVDYASAPETVDFSSKPKDLGTLTLALVPSVDGGP